MNQEEVKQKLLKLHTCAEDFTVVFSGRKNKKVNGLYKFGNKEILIHNLNFTVDDTLMYTAIHELAHHLMYTERGLQGSRAHTQAFWACFHDLLDKAKRDGVYRILPGEETRKALDEARDLVRKIAELQRRLGQIMFKIHEDCREQGLRAEDLIENEAQISRSTAHKVMKMADLGLPEALGADIQEAIVQERDGEARQAMLAAAKEGKSVAQVKQAAKGLSEKPDESEELNREKSRLEKTIGSLTRRLQEVQRLISALDSGEEDGGVMRKASDRTGRGAG
jgi:hypothetical protein